MSQSLSWWIAFWVVLFNVLCFSKCQCQVRPGLVSKDTEGRLTCQPIFSRIVSLFAEQNELQYAVPGGLIGVGTKIEPTLCRADRLVGQVYILLHIFFYIKKISGKLKVSCWCTFLTVDDVTTLSRTWTTRLRLNDMLVHNNTMMQSIRNYNSSKSFFLASYWARNHTIHILHKQFYNYILLLVTG